MVTALSLDTDRADIKKGGQNRRKNCSWNLCADIIIESHRFFLVCTKNGSAPKIFGYQALLYLIATPLGYVPSAEPIADTSGLDEHHAQKAMAATGSHGSLL